jgi:phenylacetate-CoA ligase
LENLRRERLKSLIDYCYAHVPYVKTRMQERGISPSQIREPSDLDLLPLMKKADVREHRESLRSDVGRKFVRFTTGGSTGEPLIFDLSKRRIASQVASRQRVSRWWGVSVGTPELALWGSPVELTHQDWLRSVRDKFLATRLLSAFEMNEATMSRYLDILESSGCGQIFAYPSAIYMLCLLAKKQERNLRGLGIKVVFVTSEVLLPYQRDLISETLNCPVSNGYGGRESGYIANECPHGGMHIMADAIILEVVDSEGRPVPIGEAGEIVVTDLYSEEAPFIRYATGDIGALSARQCACGRPYPLLEGIDGRSNDSIVAPDGRIINALALVYPLREVEGIEQFRITQKSRGTFHVQIMRTEHFETESEDRIRNAWIQLLRSPLQVTFEYVTGFSRQRSGKFRHVVSEVMNGKDAGVFTP